MKALRAALTALCFGACAMGSAAFGQGLSTLSSDGFAPMSLMPDAAPIPDAGSFKMIAPESGAAGGSDETGIAAPAAAPTRSLKQSAVAEVVQETPAAEEQAALARVPMPPRRPFNLGFGKKQKPLLALKVEEAPKVAATTRSLLPLDDLPGVRDRSSTLIQQASLGSASTDETGAPDASNFVGEGRIGGGILKQTPSVQTGCLRPDLLAMLRKAGKRFGRPVVITSGFRGGGRRGSYHRKCMAADVKIDGVSKGTLAAYFRSLPEAGGVGTYCHNGVVHIDTAEPRNWTYCGFRRTSFSLRGGGWGNGAHVASGKPLPDGDDGE